MDALKRFYQGALGAALFGVYHQYTTNRIFNENVEIKQKYFMDRMEAQEMNEIELQQKTLNEKLNKLELLISEQRKGWLW